MKLLFDQNLSFKLCRSLVDLFPGSSHVRLEGLDMADDHTVWNHARDGGFTLVTLDADFAELAAWHGPPPKVIWLRRGNQPTRIVATVLRSHADAINAFGLDASLACLEIY